MLNKSLVWKLTLAFLLVAVTTAALVAVFIRITSADRLSRLITDQQRSDLQSSLSEYYVQHGSWMGVTENWQQIRTQMFATPLAQSNDHGPGPGRSGNGGSPGTDR